MAQQVTPLRTNMKCIRKEDFDRIQSYGSFDHYQLNPRDGIFLPPLLKEQFLTIKRFDSYEDFRLYLFDTNDRPWTSDVSTASCSASQFDADYGLAIEELALA